MIVIDEIDLKDFEFWGGAKWFIELLTDEEIERLDEFMGDFFESSNRTPSRTNINDFVICNKEMIAQAFCGYEDEEELLEHRLKQIDFEL